MPQLLKPGNTSNTSQYPKYETIDHRHCLRKKISQNSLIPAPKCEYRFLLSDINWISLGCGQKQDIWGRLLDIIHHFIEQTTIQIKQLNATSWRETADCWVSSPRRQIIPMLWVCIWPDLPTRRVWRVAASNVSCCQQIPWRTKTNTTSFRSLQN